MKKEVFIYLRNYTFDPNKINRLIISAYLRGSEIASVKNNHLSKYIIKDIDVDFEILSEFVEIENISTFEQLIELFEFVISPEEKTVNGAVYTPEYIREYIVENSFESSDENIGMITICDPACGCAGFLLTAAKFIKRHTTRSYSDIYSSQLFGLDIEEYSIDRSKLLLSLLAISEGEDEAEFSFNLHVGNALSFKWEQYIKNFTGFDFVLGNPPYVCSRNMDQASLDLMVNWEVSKSGHPDLYIPFFQLGYEILKPDGILGYITVNTFIKSINGRALRDYFSKQKAEFKIINFGGEQVFKNRSTYTCLCFIQKREGAIRYTKSTSDKLNGLEFISYNYDLLHNHDGWNLVDSEEQSRYIDQIEAVGSPLKEKYTTRNGIATLKNHIYKFFPIDSNNDYYWFTARNGLNYQVERGICRDIINPNKVRTNEGINQNTEKVIFPYIQNNGETRIIGERELRLNFPHTYNYLNDQREILSTRDKGKREYEEWYAYGRRQSLDINSFKLFFPHLSERPSFTISEDRNLLFYSGIAIISDSLRELQVLKIILESDVFFDYIKCITKDYASGYISMSKNYIKNFGICDLIEDDKTTLLESKNPEELLRQFYQLDLDYKVREHELANVAEPNILYGK